MDSQIRNVSIDRMKLEIETATQLMFFFVFLVQRLLATLQQIDREVLLTLYR